MNCPLFISDVTSYLPHSLSVSREYLAVSSICQAHLHLRGFWGLEYQSQISTGFILLVHLCVCSKVTNGEAFPN